MGQRIPMKLFMPEEGRFLQFWTNCMTVYIAPGITGRFKDGEFWTQDGADRYGVREVARWAYVGSPLRCQASGCDGCEVCRPANVAIKARP